MSDEPTALRSWTCGCHTVPHAEHGRVLAPCEHHGAIWEQSAREYVTLHPDGRCTPTCGCVPFEAISR